MENNELEALRAEFQKQIKELKELVLNNQVNEKKEKKERLMEDIENE